ncbi:MULTISPECIES: hypothetical protein [Pseudomonas]|uniref:hypothetical protein n=1 Tax=Pseudomonas TaxID=286 RepID=UPI001BE65C4A|nr:MULTISPECIES: hypothetical protein [Pseudomonas]MBT2339952.1 hypothetical protein [Pseudomonas fluorescens]MCD4527828.1 hypothetical protein [Pseudomonas sp. C3-2018]
MSGPKVVRIVTREEIISICEGHLQRLERAVERWQTQATRLGELSEQERAAALARHARLRALLAEDRLAELQKAVPVEIEHLRRDLEDREERAILRAAERRQRDRRVQENAATLLDALQAKPESVDQALLESLSRLASGASREDAERLLAEGFARLSKASEEPTLSDTQRALVQQLKVDEPEVSLREWIAAREPDATRDVRLLRIDRHIVELQLLQGAERAAPFLLALEKAETQTDAKRRNLLLDSLVLDLAASTRNFQSQRECLEQLRDLASEIETYTGIEHATLLGHIGACTTDTELSAMAGLIEQCKTLIAAHLQDQAALARREAVLGGLASLGYEVREGMATAWAETGRVVLRKTATPGYGVEVGGKADNGRLQVRAVALSSDRDRTRDRDIETIWCGEFQRLQALLKDKGGELLIERALSVGEVPLKETSISGPGVEAIVGQQKTLHK